MVLGRGVWRQPRRSVIVRRLVAARLDSEMTQISAGPISMIRAAYLSVRERSWNRDRSRRIDAMLKRERAGAAATAEWLEAMAMQLLEIRALPQTMDPSR